MWRRPITLSPFELVYG
jgi:hypothetical protein